MVDFSITLKILYRHGDNLTHGFTVKVILHSYVFKLVLDHNLVEFDWFVEVYSEFLIVVL